MQQGAIILCGGKSQRMGRDKATLPFRGEPMLQRIVRLVAEVIDPAQIVVVAARDQPLPRLPDCVRIAFDEHPGRGPLEGCAAGFRRLVHEVDALFLTSCDAPFLQPAFIRFLFQQLGSHEIAVPDDGERLHPLTAVYRTTLLGQIESQLNADHLSLRRLLENVKTLKVARDQLQTIDPTLSSLRNLNTPADFRQAEQERNQ